MIRNAPIRCLISLLLAAWLPFCCCDLQSLTSVCVACQDDDGVQNRIAYPNADWTLQNHSALSHCHEHDSAPPSTPGSPKHGNDHDKGPCTCNDHKQTTVGVLKATIEFPTPVLAYILPDWEPIQSIPGLSAVHWSDSGAPLRPPTSLLRQHCALIV